MVKLLKGFVSLHLRKGKKENLKDKIQNVPFILVAYQLNVDDVIASLVWNLIIISCCLLYCMCQ